MPWQGSRNEACQARPAKAPKTLFQAKWHVFSNDIRRPGPEKLAFIHIIGH
jgi:hypothetical protein